MHWDHYRNQSLDIPPASHYTAQNDHRIGPVYRKALFRRYTDDSFKVPLAHDPALGIIGPIIRAEAGDRIEITFLNKAKYPHSLHPHAIEENNLYELPGLRVSPGEQFKYVWDIPANYEFPINQSSVVWAYSSKASPVEDVNAGLLGLVVIYTKGTLALPSPGSTFQKPKDTDQEIFTLMTNTNENESRYFNESAERVGFDREKVEKLKQDPWFHESNRMYHINGYVYNNNKDIRIFYGYKVRWYVISFGVSDTDAHTAHWHGATLLYHGHRVDVVDLLPVSFEVLDMVPDNEGQWLFHCHVASHFEAGMSAVYQVEKLVYTGDEGWG
ncbi:Cupredoxin [Backusella circina FSU 941]|nr:Cupredoxin [Backusella circina FSU 941]